VWILAVVPSERVVEITPGDPGYQLHGENEGGSRFAVSWLHPPTNCRRSRMKYWGASDVLQDHACWDMSRSDDWVMRHIYWCYSHQDSRIWISLRCTPNHFVQGRTLVLAAPGPCPTAASVIQLINHPWPAGSAASLHTGGMLRGSARNARGNGRKLRCGAGAILAGAELAPPLTLAPTNGPAPVSRTSRGHGLPARSADPPHVQSCQNQLGATFAVLGYYQQ
jgi:hypothetical protein